MTLAEIRNPHCERCPLSAEGAQTICMMGTGPLPARLAVIGEAPGGWEDRDGVPFIGPAGQKLDQEMAAVGIDRADVFATNTVRCRPPENRDPTTAERKACKPYLDAELDLVKPELTLLLGNSAMKSVLGMSGITSKANAVYVGKDGRSYLPMLHPAYVLRDPSKADNFRAGLHAAKRFLDGENKPPVTQVKLVRTAQGLSRLLAELQTVTDPIVIDVETSSLFPWLPKERLDMIAFSWVEGESWVLPLEHPQQDWPVDGLISENRRWLVDLYSWLGTALQGKRLVGHNIKFDLQWLRTRGVRAEGYFDTMVAAHLLDENRSKGLKNLSRMYLGAELYEEGVKFDGTTSLRKLALYNGRDTDYTLRLYHLFRAQLIEQPRLARIFRFLSMPAVNALVDVELRGFPVDEVRLEERHEAILDKLGGLEEDMSEYIPLEDLAVKGLSWHASLWLEKLLYETLGLPVLAISAKTNRPSTARAVLDRLRDRHPIVPLLLEHRKWTKWESTYTRPWREQIEQVGKPRLYPSYNITGTETGRTSSNFQQVPRNNYIRGIIGAQEGWRIIEADFSQIELRIAAMLSGDTAMQQVYAIGGDLHREMAAAITGKPAEMVTKEERSRAKAVSFGFLFGMGWRNFIPYAKQNYGIDVSPEEAQHYRASFFLRFPRLVAWHEKQRRLVNVLGYVDSPIGRRRRLPAVHSTDREVAAEAERNAINSPVQGFASDLCLLAMSILENDELLNKWSDCKVLGQLHDSIIFESKASEAEDNAAHIKDVMEHLPIQRRFGYSPPVPIVADVSVHQWWGGE